jgi:hypothetical protein
MNAFLTGKANTALTYCKGWGTHTKRFYAAANIPESEQAFVPEDTAMGTYGADSVKAATTDSICPACKSFMRSRIAADDRNLAEGRRLFGEAEPVTA